MITQSRFDEEAISGHGPPEDDPVARLRLQLNELQAYARQQWAARTDRVLLGVRRLAVLAAAGVVALFALAAGVIMSVVLLLAGATGGLATVLGGRLWLAALIIGASVLFLVAIGVLVMYGGWVRASKQRTKQKYEHRQREQRQRFGRSAHDRATQP